MRRSIVVLSAALWVLGTMPIAARMNEQLLVSTGWLQQHRLDRGLTIVEIGDRESYASGHIAGARFVALRDLLGTRDSIPNELPDPAALQKTLSAAGIPDRGRIILYSRDVIAAARAFFTLDYFGSGERTSLLDGGFAKWRSEGRETESGTPEIAAGGIVARPRPDVLVEIGALRVILDRRLPTALIDAREPAQFLGAEAGADITCPGHIPSAVNVPWSMNLTSSMIPVFRSAEELRALYDLRDNETAIVYCRTGMQASVAYFALRYLGYDVRLYDGSYMEWNREESGSWEVRTL